MKSFATRSQRDRTFDRLVQNSNHSTLIQRTVPICKTASNKSPPVLQRPVSPRKCVIVTSFTGDDDGELHEDTRHSPPSLPGRIYSRSAESTRDSAMAVSVINSKIKSSENRKNCFTSLDSSAADPCSGDSLKTKTKVENESSGHTPPLRVTFRLQKCPSTSQNACATSKATIIASNSSLSSGVKSTYCVQNKAPSNPLTLSFRRRPEHPKDSSASTADSMSWEVTPTKAKDDVPSSKLSSPPLIKGHVSTKAQSRELSSPPQGVKRKTTVENSECEQLEAFVSGIEERSNAKRRMLQPVSNASTSSTASSASTIIDRCPSVPASKSRSVLTQKILMSKSISAPMDASASDQSLSGRKRQSLLKKSNSLAINRKAVYNPRQWIGGDLEDEPSHASDGEKQKVKEKSRVPTTSAFDFDSDEESSKSDSLPTRPPQQSTNASLTSSRKCRPFVTSSYASTSSSSSQQPPVSNSTHTPSVNPKLPTTVHASSRPVPRSEQDNKALYTVVRNVKEAHECQESGETQDLLDDVEYMLDGLKRSESPATRCLSLLRLCKECLVHSFRMTLKAHGLLPRIFAHVIDAPNDDGDCGVALHTAALLFILSRDKLAAGDLDREGLRLLLRLLRCDGKGLTTLQSRELDRIRSRLKPVIEQATKSSATKASHNSVEQRLHVTCFTAKDLAVESLLNLSVRKASDWFKNELRKEGGLDHFCRATIDAMDYFNNELETQDLTEFMLDRLRRIEQYMGLLENMTYMNGENQEYLVLFEERSFLDSIAACLRLGVNNLPRIYKPDSIITKVIVACLLSIWRVMLNVSHDNEKCSDRLGAHPLLIPLSLHCVLRLPRRLPNHRRFDLLVLTLGFLVNLVEHCDENRARLAYTQVRLPWRRPKKNNNRRRGLVLNPSAVQNESSSSSDEYDCSDSSSDGDDDCSKPKTALEALVNLFLERYEASERHEMEQGSNAENEDEMQSGAGIDDKNEKDQDEDGDGMKWRLIEDKQLERQRRGRHRPFRLIGRKRADGDGDCDSEEENGDDSDSDSGADVEFMPSTQEQTAALESALSRAGEHMEASMTASYVALLLGCMMRGSRRRVDRVQGRLPNGRFKPLALSLAKFLGFMSLTSAVGQAGGKSMLEVVHFLHELDGDNEDDEPQLSTQKQQNEDRDRTSTVCSSSSMVNSYPSS